MSRRKPHYGACPTYKSHSTWLIPVNGCDFCKGYGKALSSAVEAVKALNPTWVSQDDAEWEELDRLEVIAAIEALGGER